MLVDLRLGAGAGVKFFRTSTEKLKVFIRARPRSEIDKGGQFWTLVRCLFNARSRIDTSVPHLGNVAARAQCQSLLPEQNTPHQKGC
jgi:hypothetical protein